jgi:hypothetical protein
MRPRAALLILNDTEYQRDGKGCLRTDAIENASEAEHDTDPGLIVLLEYRRGAPSSTLTAITFWRPVLRQSQQERINACGGPAAQSKIQKR